MDMDERKVNCIMFSSLDVRSIIINYIVLNLVERIGILKIVFSPKRFIRMALKIKPSLNSTT